MIRRVVLISLCLGVLLVAFIICSQPDHHAGSPKTGNGTNLSGTQPKHDPPHATEASVSRPYFEIDSSRRHLLLIASREIVAGSSFQQVINVLGVPTIDVYLPRDRDGARGFRLLKYYLRIWEKGLVNEKEDEYIEVVLDESTDRVLKLNIKLRARTSGIENGTGIESGRPKTGKGTESGRSNLAR